MERKKPSIKSRLSDSYDKQVQQNTKALISIIDVIQFLTKQGLALRGPTWNKSTRRENGNFTTLIDLMAKYSVELNSHLLNSARNARYLSPQIQNELILINADLIRKSIIVECNTSLFWSIMVDEATDVSTTEQVSICIRYIRDKGEELEVCEEFLGFCSVPSTDAETITSAIVTFINNCGLNTTRLVGKGFDGASNMSGHISGVSARLEQLYPNAKYFTHCHNHALNLVIVASCKSVPDIRNFMDAFKELTLFFAYSAKRKHILQQHLKSEEDRGNLLADCFDEEEDPIPKRQYQGLPVLSDTRWLTRVDSIDCLLKHYRAVCEAVESVRDSSTGQSASDADSFLKRLLSFEFLASAVICRHILAYTRPLTVALQAKDCDLLKAHRMAQRLVKTLEIERSGADRFNVLWQRIIEIAASLNIEPGKRRTVVRQRNRANPPVEEIEAHYRVAYFYAFLDHTITHLKTRFPEELEGALLATSFLPGSEDSLSDEVVAKIKREFQCVLPYPSEFENEVSAWRVCMAEICPDDKNKKNLLSTCTFAEKNCGYYPNIHAILLLLLSLPVGACSCERSFSSLRRLKTWCRNSMSDDRLNNLATGYINHERTPSPDEVLKVWDQSGHRRIALAFQKT